MIFYFKGKRADEAIYFGNQQNKARVIVKKSGTDNLVSHQNEAMAPLGDSHDTGAEVVAHQEVPVTADLGERVEAVLEKEKDGEKMTDVCKRCI